MEIDNIKKIKVEGGSLIQGNCLFVMKKIPDNTIDGVITDPPYGLFSKPPNIIEVLTHWIAGDTYEHNSSGFMNQTWDSFIPGPEIWKELYRIIKPGGYVLVFSGTRTWDLMGIALRISGFFIKDTCMWLYGSGFPKSLSIHKTLLKTETSDCEANYWKQYGTSLKPAWEPIIIAQKPLEGTYANNVLKHGVGALNIDACRISLQGEKAPTGSGKSDAWRRAEGREDKFESPTKETPATGRFPANLLLSHHPECVKIGTKKVKGSGTSKTFHEGYEGESATGFIRGVSHPGNQHADPDGTETVEEFQCVEDCPIRMLQGQSGESISRKGKLRKGESKGNFFNTNQVNCEYDDSGYANRFFLNLEGESSENWKCHEDCPIRRLREQSGITTVAGNRTERSQTAVVEGTKWLVNNHKSKEYPGDKGYADRFFKNIENESVYECHQDCPIRMLDDSVPASGGTKTRDEMTPTTHEGPAKFGYSPDRHQFNYGDGGGPSRFFYCGKASKKERGEGNNHPTVKPLKLLEYLVKLITPPKPGILLDPFAGSGSTLLACKELDVPFIGIELEPEYIEICKKRLGAIETPKMETPKPEEKLLRVAVVGSRKITDPTVVTSNLDKIKEAVSIFQVVSGGAPGIDTIAEEYADDSKQPKNIFPADWNKHGKAAGYIRNGDIVANSDVTLAFWDGKSSGTLDTITKSQKAKHPTIILICNENNIVKLIYENVPRWDKGIASSAFTLRLQELMLAIKEVIK
jgi:DNA modification methylase